MPQKGRDEKGRFIKGTTLFRGITKGRKLTDEQKNNISVTLKRLYKEGKLKHPCIGRILTEEHKQKLRENAKSNPNYGMRGKKQTQYAKEKLRTFNTGKNLPKEIREKISRTLKRKIKNGTIDIKHRFKKGQSPWDKGKTFNEDHKRKLSENNFWRQKTKKVELFRKKLSERMKKESISKYCKSPSKPQLKLFYEVKRYYKPFKVCLNYKVAKKGGGYYYLDVAIPELMINFEYDGFFWHRIKYNTEKEEQRRDSYLRSLGWNIIRILE